MSDAPAPDGPPRDLPAATVRFCRALRERGIAVTPAESVDAVRALEVVDLADRAEVYLALRAVLVGRVEEHAAFDAAFAAFWGVSEPRGAAAASRRGDGTPPIPPELMRPAPARRRAPLSLQSWMRPDATDPEPVGAPAVGEGEPVGRKDFSTFGSAELEEVARVARRIARRLAARPGRRWRPARRGGRVHPRRTLRGSLRTGGEVVELAFRARKPRRTRLVLLCDVSGSMDLYSRFLLLFLFALQNQFARVETFVFSTRLSRVTEQLRGPSYLRSLDRLSREVRDWSGGTRIGASLAAFERDWSHLVDRRSVVIVLSDGWDTGEPEELGGALRSLRRRAGRMIWLNPLLGSASYQPLTRGMQAALPHLDVFAPAHNLESLEALARHLVL